MAHLMIIGCHLIPLLSVSNAFSCSSINNLFRVPSGGRFSMAVVFISWETWLSSMTGETVVLELLELSSARSFLHFSSSSAFDSEKSCDFEATSVRASTLASFCSSLLYCFRSVLRWSWHLEHLSFFDSIRYSHSVCLIIPSFFMAFDVAPTSMFLNFSSPLPAHIEPLRTLSNMFLISSPLYTQCCLFNCIPSTNTTQLLSFIITRRVIRSPEKNTRRSQLIIWMTLWKSSYPTEIKDDKIGFYM